MTDQARDVDELTEPQAPPTADEELHTSARPLPDPEQASSLLQSTSRLLTDVQIMRGAIVLISMAATIWILNFTKVILIPIVLAFFLSYVLTPFVNTLMKARIPRTRINIPRGLAALIVVVATVLLGGLLGTFIGDQIRGLAMEIPTYEEQLVDNITRIQESVSDMQTRVEGYLEPLRREDERIAPAEELSEFRDDNPASERIQVFLDQSNNGDFWTNASGFIAGGLSGFLGFIAQALMCIFVLVFILAQGPSLQQRLVDAAGTRARRRRAMEVILSNINEDVQRYLFNRFATNTVVALLTGTIFYLYGLDFAFLLGIFAGLFNFIPYVGPIVGTIFPATIAYMQFGDWQSVMWIVLIYASVTGLEGNLVTPYVIGRHLKINSLAVLLSAIFWGWMWGAIGLLLAIPIVATLKSVSENVDSLKPLAAFLRG